MSSTLQAGWRWCSKCQGLTFAGGSTLGPCPAGDTHLHKGSWNYIVEYGDPIEGAQANWRSCSKCLTLIFGGSVDAGVCAAGGKHSPSGSNYNLTANAGPSHESYYQDNWLWCRKCQALAFGGSGTRGICPSGGQHDHTGSFNYTNAALVTEAGWRWCHKCHGLIFGQGVSVGACSSGGAHDLSNSWLYILDKDWTGGSTGGAQTLWRLCRFCKCLYFAGSSIGVCTGTGGHGHNIDSGSSIYAVPISSVARRRLSG